ncbi:MAG TPA: MASE1 domain-containing protein [Vicinamibacterales bacterium]|nr:MASE1 domain-containing protein [Vicinamibacterales bacterium]
MRKLTALTSALRSWYARNESIGTIVLNGILAIVAWGIAEIVLYPAQGGRAVTPIWPPVGLAVAVTYIGGFRMLPGIVLGSLAFGLRHNSWPLATFIALAQVAQPMVDVRIMRAFGFDPKLERVRDPIILSLIAGPAGSFLAALLAVSSYFVVGSRPTDVLPYDFMLWWLRDWLGVMVTAPLIFAWAFGRSAIWTWPRIGEAVALFLTLFAGSQLMFGLWGVFATRDVPIAFVFFPIVGWAGLRFGTRGATTIVAMLSAFAIAIAGMGIGPFSAFPVEFTQFLLFAFLALGSLSGLLLAAIMAERDDALTKRLLLEEQLRHSQKMEAVGRLAGGIAHDFNNLLTAIIGYTEIVLTSLDPTDERRADAEEIGRAAMRAADLTRQMLAFSRRQVLQPKVIDLNTALSKVEPMLRRVIGEDISMTVTGKASSAFVRVDPGQVEQVVMNLVVNARDAMPKGGRLTVETADAVLDDAALADSPEARPGAYVMLSVSDTGTGMSTEVRARIFEPYFTTKDVGKGTGLGLSTAYGIVRQSEGHISVSSELGLGTTFRIYLPRSEAPVQSAADTGGEKMPDGTEHILLVEDDSSVRRLSKELLIRLGYSVTEAASGRAGLALGSDDTRHFDLAVCDVILGDMSGPAVAEALSALRPAIRVLYMSGYTDEAIVRTGVLDEGKPFLQKPFTPMQLAKKVREVLDEPETGSL